MVDIRRADIDVAQSDGNGNDENWCGAEQDEPNW
jgi:hypothetical protein